MSQHTNLEVIEPTSSTSGTPLSSIKITADGPGLLKVIRRNSTVTEYDPSKISVAITKAFLAAEGSHAAASTRIHEIVAKLTQKVTDIFMGNILTKGNTIHIEDIQNEVETALMNAGEHKVARAYIIYREKRREEREQALAQLPKQEITLQVKLHDGSLAPLDAMRLSQTVLDACQGLSDIDPQLIINDTLRNLYDGIPINDVNKALQLSARALIEKEPNYSFVAARLLLDALRGEALSFLNIQTQATTAEMQSLYSTYFKHYIQRGIELELLDPQLQTFDLDRIGQALNNKNDQLFTYLGLQTLYDRYFIHSFGQHFELPQAFFMRVAMGLALNEQQKEERAIEFYQLLSSFDFMSSTPTLFNAGTLFPQLSSCFLTTIPDDLKGIYEGLTDNALLSKYAGGVANDWTPVRASNAHIKGTNGPSQGVVPFLNVANASAVAVNQGGKRKGAVVAYLSIWHLDIEAFLELRKNTGDERRRTHDMNTACWISDLFMKRVETNADWTLFSPNETTDLHDLYGLEFEKAYLAYEAKVRRGEMRNYKTVSAVNLWRKLLGMLFETGHPWITFKDPCNLRSPQQHVGVVHSSNLCTEITLNTSVDEIAVCNLGSINLPAHVTEKGLDLGKLNLTVQTAVRMLDNVIDINYYTVPQAKRSNMKHRPVGLGIMGFQDALYKLKLAYGSDAAVEFADRSMEAVSYYTISASSDLAAERGSYESFPGSLWSQGILPIDSIKLLQQTRGEYLQQDNSSTMDWNALRNKVVQQGMRNSNIMAIAPTATISNICGVSQSIEPTYQNLFVKSNMSGEFTVINPYLVADLKQLGLWDEVMVNDLKYYNGSIRQIDRIPQDLKERYATAFEIDPHWLIDAASRRIKWIDQSQSLNLYMAQPSGKKLDNLYKLAWKRGLKTTYYLRSLGASDPEKSTIDTRELNVVPINDSQAQACSIDNPDCESCQ